MSMIKLINDNINGGANGLAFVNQYYRFELYREAKQAYLTSFKTDLETCIADEKHAMPHLAVRRGDASNEAFYIVSLGKHTFPKLLPFAYIAADKLLHAGIEIQHIQHEHDWSTFKTYGEELVDEFDIDPNILSELPTVTYEFKKKSRYLLGSMYDGKIHFVDVLPISHKPKPF